MMKLILLQKKNYRLQIQICNQNKIYENFDGIFSCIPKQILEENMLR